MYRKYLLVIINLAIITIGMFIVADVINIFLGHTFEISSNKRLFQRRRSLSPHKEKEDKIDYHSVIISGNIFNSEERGIQKDPIIEEPPPVPSIEEGSQSLPKTDLKVKLIGTVVGGERYSYAIIEDRTKRRQDLYRLEDLISNDARIIKIERNKVTFLRGGREEILQMYDKKRPSQKRKIKQTASVASGIRQEGLNRWVLDKREVTDALDNLPKLLTKARIIPNFKGGKPDGFKIFSIVANSFYDKIGLKNGDVIQRINGIEIKDPTNFLKVFLQLKDEDSITLDMIRNNKKETFDYEIR